MYLNNDPTVECSFTSKTYSDLFGMSLGALALYGFVIPSTVFLILRSKWSRTMRIHDRGGYDALFGFLTSRYNKQCYMWEVVVFLNKSISVIIPAYNYGNAFRQAIQMMVASLAYSSLLLVFSPFANKLMNMVSVISNSILFCMYFCAVLFLTEFGGEPVLNGLQTTIVAACLSFVSALAILVLLLCAFYESAFLTIMHRDLFISKWVISLETAIGDSIRTNSVFSFFYVHFNDVSKGDIQIKKNVLEQALKPKLDDLNAKLGAWRLGSALQRLWFEFRAMSSTFWIKLKNLDLFECRPEVAVKAVQTPEGHLLRCLNKIGQRLGSSRSTDVVKSMPVKFGLLSSVSRWFKRLFNGKVMPAPAEPDAMEMDARVGDTDPPQDFLVWLLRYQNFVDETFSPQAMTILLSLLLMEDKGDVLSRDSKRYLARIRANIAPTKKLLGRIFQCLRNLDEVNSRLQERHDKWKIWRDKLINAIFGGNMLCLLRFQNMSYEDINSLLLDCNFEDFSQQSQQESKTNWRTALSVAQSSAPQHAAGSGVAQTAIQQRSSTEKTLDEKLEENRQLFLCGVEGEAQRCVHEDAQEGEGAVEAAAAEAVGAAEAAAAAAEAAAAAALHPKAKTLFARATSAQPEGCVGVGGGAVESSARRAQSFSSAKAVQSVLHPIAGDATTLHLADNAARQARVLAVQHLRALAEIAALDKSVGALLNLRQGLAPTAAAIEEGLEDKSAAALQRAAVAEANVQTLTSQVKDLQIEFDAAVRRSDIEIATLNAQVENLQAALQAATQALKSTLTESKNDASAPTAAAFEEGLEDKSAAALQRAAVAEANVQTLTSQVKDLQVALQAQTRQKDFVSPSTAVRNADINSAAGKSAAALQRAAAAGANVQTLTSQVKDLQVALQVQTRQKDFVSPSTAVRNADINSAAGKSAAAGANVQTFTSQVIDSFHGTGRLKRSEVDSARLTDQVKDLLHAANHFPLHKFLQSDRSSGDLLSFKKVSSAVVHKLSCMHITCFFFVQLTIVSMSRDTALVCTTVN
jgi:hypothetical protein